MDKKRLHIIVVHPEATNRVNKNQAGIFHGGYLVSKEMDVLKYLDGKIVAVVVMLSYHVDMMPDSLIAGYVDSLESFKHRIQKKEDMNEARLQGLVDTMDMLIDSLRDYEKPGQMAAPTLGSR